MVKVNIILSKEHGANCISDAPHPNAKVLGIELQKLFEANGYI